MPDLAVLTFRHANGAERAYADARAQSAGASWLREVVFVERHTPSEAEARALEEAVRDAPLAAS